MDEIIIEESGSAEVVEINSGWQGPIGYVGSQGEAGPQGPIGYTGSRGTDGLNGTNGTNGIDGQIGPQGPIGYTGSSGITINDASASTSTTYSSSYINTQLGDIQTALTAILGV